MPPNRSVLTEGGATDRRETPLNQRVSPASAHPLPRVIGITGLAFSCFNSIVGAGIFAIPAAAVLGPAAIIAYLICAVLMGLMALCFAEIGSRVAAPGGVYGYARVSFGPVIGGIAGTLLWSVNSVFASA